MSEALANRTLPAFNSSITTASSDPDCLANKKLIIFDWDGTLMDSIGLIVESMHIAAEPHGFFTTDKQVKDIIGLSLSMGIDILYPSATEAQRAAIQKDYSDYYVANSGRTPFFSKIEAMLQNLQQQGKQLAVATGKSRRGLDRIMRASSSDEYFVSTRCADESGSKPDPKMLVEILQDMNKQVAEAVYIGDSIYDIQMANKIGMTSIAVDYGTAARHELTAQRPTYQVTTPQALAKLLMA